MRSGNRIPVDALGPLPGGLIDAWHFCGSMKWAWPATIALFLFISEYATVIAFAGLGFVEVDRQGPQAPVLNLTERNHHFPYEAIGDPLLPFTASRLELLVEDSAGTPRDQRRGEILKLAKEEAMVASFLGAADSIAHGNSIFLKQYEDFLSDPTLLLLGQDTNEDSIFSNLEDTTVLYGSSSFLAGIHLEIPLDCAENVMDAMKEERGQDGWMTRIKELRGPDNWMARSHAPNCTFTATRSSGIHSATGRKAETTAYARVGPGKDVALLVRGQEVDDQSTFVFPYEGLYLARETKDFRQGRQVFGFGGVRIGNATIPFEATVVASGKKLADPPKALDPEDQNTVRTKEYVLVSKVKDEKSNCPADPSGIKDSLCLVTTKITCETFGSEVGSGGLLQSHGSSSNSAEFPDKLEHQCVVDGDVEIVWGRNYEVDQQLLAAVAGVQSRNTGWALSLRQQRTLSIHSVPAALFMLGTLGSRTSVEPVRSTTIDFVFIAFMLVPVSLCVAAGCAYLIGLKYLLPLPNDGKSLVVTSAKLLQKQATTTAEISEIEESLRAGEDSIWLGESLFNVSAEARKKEVAEAKKKAKALRRASALADKGSVPLEFEWDGHSFLLGSNRNLVSKASPSAADKMATPSGAFSVGHEEPIKEESDEIIFVNGEPAEVDIEVGKNTGEGHGLDLGEEIDPKASVRAANSEDADDPFVDDPERIKAKNRCKMSFYTGQNRSAAAQAHSATSRTSQTASDKEVAAKIKNKKDSDSDKSSVDSVDQYASAARMTELYSTPVQEDSYCLIFMKGSGIYVAICVIFSIVLTILGVAFIGATGSGSTSTQTSNEHSPPSQQNESLVPKKEGVSLPPGCFLDNNELRASIAAYLHGSEELQVGVLQKYGKLEEWCVDYVEDFSFVFAGLPAGLELNVSNWNVSGATKFAFTFYNFDSSLNELDVSSWDVSSAQVFRGMFQGSKIAESDLSQWDVSSGTDFAGMFRKSRDFNSDLSKWNVSSGTDFSWMFDQASSFSADLSGWNVSSGTDFGYMFREARSFNSKLPASRNIISKSTPCETSHFDIPN